MNHYGGFSHISPYYGGLNAYQGGLVYNYARPLNVFPHQYTAQSFQSFQPYAQTPFIQNTGFNQCILSPKKPQLQEAKRQNVQTTCGATLTNIQQFGQHNTGPRTLFASSHFNSNIYSTPGTFQTQFGGAQRSPLMLSSFLQPSFGQNIYASPYAQQLQNSFHIQGQFTNINSQVLNQNCTIQENQGKELQNQNDGQNLNIHFDAAMARSNQTLQNIQKKVAPQNQELKETVSAQEQLPQYLPKNTNLTGNQSNIENNSYEKEIYKNAEAENNANIHILRYEDGFIYEGDAIDSQRNGFGVLKNEEGHIVYLGSWENDAFHGQGELRNVLIENFDGPFDFADFGELGEKWEKYEGDFKENAFHGRGELYLSNGEKFVGEFYDGKIEGEGIFYSLDGRCITGIWKENILVETR